MRNVSTRTAGLAILLLGVWGGLIAFVGPYFNFVLGPDRSWTWTSGRLWLDVLPAIAAVLGGLMLMGGGPRAGGRLGALLALLSGIWFAVGPDLSHVWTAVGAEGAAHGGAVRTGLELLSFHSGLGVVVASLAAFCLPGRLRRLRSTEAVAADEVAAERAGARPMTATASPAGTARTAGTAGTAGTAAAAGAADTAGTSVADQPTVVTGRAEPARLAAERDLAAVGAGGRGGIANDGVAADDGMVADGIATDGTATPGAAGTATAGRSSHRGWRGRITGRSSS